MPGICKDCGASARSPKHNLCWSCIVAYRDYGMSRAEVRAERRRTGRICVVCQKYKRGKLTVNGKPVCAECHTALSVLADPAKRARLMEEFS